MHVKAYIDTPPPHSHGQKIHAHVVVDFPDGQQATFTVFIQAGGSVEDTKRKAIIGAKSLATQFNFPF